MKTNYSILDDAQVSVNKGNLTLEQQSILEACRRSLINTMHNIPWYDRIYQDDGYATMVPMGLIYVVSFFTSKDEEHKKCVLERIKNYIQDADWHTKPIAVKLRVNRNFCDSYSSIVKKYNLIDEEVFMATITRLFQLFKSNLNEKKIIFSHYQLGQH